ncbi:Protein of unknown function [Cotesia congregata]|uniref:Uncharacterized protein n=1 Tax=Cotesia congregata TaxID=51543 RepID=A0A8J2MFU4_COTCN|nr:Protein of unknown function [Cotesia congregata]
MISMSQDSNKRGQTQEVASKDVIKEACKQSRQHFQRRVSKTLPGGTPSCWRVPRVSAVRRLFPEDDGLTPSRSYINNKINTFDCFDKYILYRRRKFS